MCLEESTGSVDDKKQEIVEMYLRQDWGIARVVYDRVFVGYDLITPSGESYSIYRKVDLENNSAFDMEVVDDKIFLERLNANTLTRILRSIGDQSILECLVEKYGKLKK